MIRLPGFVDTHIHGAFGYDTSDGDAEGLVKMARSLKSYSAVAAFVPTTMTISADDIFSACEACARAAEETSSDPSCADILGIRLEGPFLNPAKAGVQDSAYCMLPRDGFELIEKIESSYPGLLRIIDISPELDGAEEFISEFSGRYSLSLAHTAADMETASRAFELGADSVTHMLNAMDPCLKRSPGIPGAAYENDGVFCELICDGYHIDPVVLKMLISLYGPGRIVGISDSMRGAGMPEGLFRLGSVFVTVKDGRTFYGEAGGLAGSVSDLGKEAKLLFSLGLSPEDISRIMTHTPLARLRMSEKDMEGRLGTVVFDDLMNFVSFE